MTGIFPHSIRATAAAILLLAAGCFVPVTALAQSGTLSQEEKEALEKIIGKEGVREEEEQKPVDQGTGSGGFQDLSLPPQQQPGGGSVPPQQTNIPKEKFDPKNAEKVHIDDDSMGATVEKLDPAKAHAADVRLEKDFSKQLWELEGQVPDSEIAARMEVLYKPSAEARADPKVAEYELKRWRELVRDYKSSKLQAALKTDLSNLKITQNSGAAGSGGSPVDVPGGVSGGSDQGSAQGTGRQAGSGQTGQGRTGQSGSSQQGQQAGTQSGSSAGSTQWTGSGPAAGSGSGASGSAAQPAPPSTGNFGRFIEKLMGGGSSPTASQSAGQGGPQPAGTQAAGNQATGKSDNQGTAPSGSSPQGSGQQASAGSGGGTQSTGQPSSQPSGKSSSQASGSAPGQTASQSTGQSSSETSGQSATPPAAAQESTSRSASGSPGVASGVGQQSGQNSGQPAAQSGGSGSASTPPPQQPPQQQSGPSQSGTQVASAAPFGSSSAEQSSAAPLPQSPNTSSAPNSGSAPISRPSGTLSAPPSPPGRKPAAPGSAPASGTPPPPPAPSAQSGTAGVTAPLPPVAPPTPPVEQGAASAPPPPPPPASPSFSSRFGFDNSGTEPAKDDAKENPSTSFTPQPAGSPSNVEQKLAEQKPVEEKQASLAPEASMPGATEPSAEAPASSSPSGGTKSPESQDPARETLKQRRTRKLAEDQAVNEALAKYKKKHFDKDESVTMTPAEEALAEQEIQRIAKMTPEERAAEQAKSERTDKVIKALNMDDLLNESEKDLNNGEMAVYGNDVAASLQVAGEGAKLYLETAGGKAGATAAGVLDATEDVLTGLAVKKGTGVADIAAEALPEPYKDAVKTTASTINTGTDASETGETADNPNKATELRGSDTALGWLKSKFDLANNSPVGQKISMWLGGAKRVTKSVRIVEEAKRDHVTNMEMIESNRGRIAKVREQNKQTQERLSEQVERQRRGEAIFALCEKDPSCNTGADAPKVVQP